MRKTKRLRDEIRETLGALVETMEPARSLQTRLLTLQRDAMAARKQELARAEDAMRSPTPRSPEVMAEAALIVDVLDGLAKAFAGLGICGSIIKTIERQDVESRITPQQRKADRAEASRKSGEFIKEGLRKREVERLAKLGIEPDAVLEGVA